MPRTRRQLEEMKEELERKYENGELTRGETDSKKTELTIWWINNGVDETWES